MSRPIVAVTMGDPAGVGPEIIAAAWSDSRLHSWCRPIVIGHPELLRRAARLRGSNVEIAEVLVPDDAAPSPALLPCMRVVSDDVLELEPGILSARCGQAAYDALVSAARLALAGQVDAITTAPLNKAALWEAGHKYPGHTELLAELCGVRDFAMLLYLAPGAGIAGESGLGVVHVTLHLGIRDVCRSLTTEAVIGKIRLAFTAMRPLIGRAPRIGVCALNPHAGESGLFGDEEETIIAPAVAAARMEGIDVRGPYGADTLLPRARDGEFDVVVAMYHDQGHIALKLLGMHRAVNVTLGLPIVRTSVAHGTAFDLAWQGRAHTSSLMEAVRVASLLARQRQIDAGGEQILPPFQRGD